MQSPIYIDQFNLLFQLTSASLSHFGLPVRRSIQHQHDFSPISPPSAFSIIGSTEMQVLGLKFAFLSVIKAYVYILSGIY